MQHVLRKGDGRIRARVLRPALAAVVVVLLAAAGGAAGVRAQTDDPHAGHGHAPGMHGVAGTPVAFTELPEPVRQQARRLVVQDWRGRMKPLDTLAHEMVMKIAKQATFEDRAPVDLYLNWMANPQAWFAHPVIAVRNEGVKDLLGVPQGTKYVSAASLFDEQGQYRIRGLVEEAHRTPDSQRSKTQRRLISFDERFNLLYMSLRGETLRIFPVPGDENRTWMHIEAVLVSGVGRNFWPGVCVPRVCHVCGEAARPAQHPQSKRQGLPSARAQRWHGRPGGPL
ncbi:MAG: hypothetical protein R6X25_03035 [Candidatus Krumholzibacteriia bacterium]